MDLRQFLLILRARYKIALFMLFVTVAATVAVGLLLPKQYGATASVVVDLKSPDPISALIAPSNMSTQIDIINSDRVAQKVVKILKLDDSPGAKKQWVEATEGKGRLEVWLANLLQKKLSVQPSRDSNIINISYKSADPGFAAAVANAFAQAYIEATIELKVEPSRQYARWFEDQGKVLRDNLEKTQARLSYYQQEKGIVANEEKLDTETGKLNELTSQLTVVQAQTSDARSKQKSGADTLPEVMQNSVITGLKSDIARLEAKLQETTVNVGTNHPLYQRMQSEISALKQQLEAETQHITGGFSVSRSVGKEKEAELGAAIAAQKKKLLGLKSQRDEVAVLQRDVDAAKNAYDVVIARFNQTNLASQTTQANVSVLTPAVEPIEALFPKPLHIMVLMSIILGTLFGAAVAFLLEMLDRRIRSANDLAEMLKLPVLGVIQHSKKRGRLPFLQRRPALTVR
ncbi:MAG: chain length determinant protein EpsF [Burkholderiales bacterium]